MIDYNKCITKMCFEVINKGFCAQKRGNKYENDHCGIKARHITLLLLLVLYFFLHVPLGLWKFVHTLYLIVFMKLDNFTRYVACKCQQNCAAIGAILFSSKFHPAPAVRLSSIQSPAHVLANSLPRWMGNGPASWLICCICLCDWNKLCRL